MKQTGRSPSILIPAAAQATREAMYPRLDRPNVIVADGHFADAVFGRVTNENGKWVWTPLGK